jgi:hypothetical protein
LGSTCTASPHRAGLEPGERGNAMPLFFNRVERC